MKGVKAEMIDKRILHSKLVDKFRALEFQMIVTESFISALPFNATEKEKNREVFESYAAHTMKNIGGFSALESALIQKKNKPMQMGYLTSLHTCCMETATAAADRVCATCSKEDSVSDVVDAAAFSEEEIKKIANDKMKLDTAAMGELISKKTIDTIKAEKEAYDADKELHDKLEDALNETKVSSDKSIDSYCNMVLNPQDPRHYISLFSKLMDTSMEAFMRYADDFDEIAPPVLSGVTDSFLGIQSLNGQQNLMEALERRIAFGRATEAVSAMEGDDDHEHHHDEDHDKKKFFKKVSNAAMISAITVYTMLETMKTMNVYSPDKDKIRKFVDSPTNFKKLLTDDDEHLAKQVNKNLDDLKLQISRADNTVALEDRTKTLESWKALIEKLPDTFSSVRESVMPKINSLTSFATERANALSENGSSFAGSLESMQYFRDRDRTIADFDRMARTYGKKPSVAEIRVTIDRAMESSSEMQNPFFNVELIGPKGEKLGTDMAQYNHHCGAGRVLECLQEIMDSSNLKKCGKRVTVYNSENCRYI